MSYHFSKTIIKSPSDHPMYDVRSMVRVKSCEAHCIFEDAVWHALIAQLTTFLLHPGEREVQRGRERAAGLTNCEAQTQRTTATAASYGSTVGRTDADADDGGGRASSVTD